MPGVFLTPYTLAYKELIHIGALDGGSLIFGTPPPFGLLPTHFNKALVYKRGHGGLISGVFLTTYTLAYRK